MFISGTRPGGKSGCGGGGGGGTNSDGIGGNGPNHQKFGIKPQTMSGIKTYRMPLVHLTMTIQLGLMEANSIVAVDAIDWLPCASDLAPSLSVIVVVDPKD